MTINEIEKYIFSTIFGNAIIIHLIGLMHLQNDHWNYFPSTNLNIQFPNINIIPLVERKDVSFILTSFQRISGTNDTSFESPKIGRLEFAKK